MHPSLWIFGTWTLKTLLVCCECGQQCCSPDACVTAYTRCYQTLQDTAVCSWPHTPSVCLQSAGRERKSCEVCNQQEGEREASQTSVSDSI